MTAALVTWSVDDMICYSSTCKHEHEKSLMCKYGRIQKKISPRLVCGSHGACLDCMLPGVQVTAGLGFFSAVTAGLGFFSVFKSFM